MGKRFFGKIVLLFLLSMPLFGQGMRITDLPLMTLIDSADVFPIVDIDASVNGITKKVTWSMVTDSIQARAINLYNALDTVTTVSWDSITNKPSYVGTPTGSGLFLSPTYMGYYSSSTWKTYMDNSGNFAFGDVGGGGAGVLWTQSISTLSIKGSINITNPTTAFAGDSLNASQIGNDLNWDNTVTKLTNGVSLSAGGITLGTASYLRSGKTLYSSTTAGFFIGAESGTPKVNIEDANSYFKWTGSALQIAGSVVISNPETFVNNDSLDLSYLQGTLSADKVLVGTNTLTYEINEKNNVIRATTAPTTHLSTGDIWIDTDDGDKPYTYNGSTWVAAYTSIDGGNLVTGTVTAAKLNVSELSAITATLGSAVVGTSSTAGYLQSYDYVASTSGWKIAKALAEFNGATVSSSTMNSSVFRSESTKTYGDLSSGIWLGKYGTSDYRFEIYKTISKYFRYDGTDFYLAGGKISGSTITGGIIQTAVSGTRMSLSSETGYNYLNYYNSSGTSIGGLHFNPSDANGLQLSCTGALSFVSEDIISFSADAVDISYIRFLGSSYPDVDIYGLNTTSIATTVGMQFGDGKLIINNSGQLTKINNLAASSYTGYSLVSDGTSFTPSTSSYSGSYYNIISNTETSNTSALAGFYAKANQGGSQAGLAIQAFASQYSDATLAGYGRLVTDASLNGLVLGVATGDLISFRVNNTEYAKVTSGGLTTSALTFSSANNTAPSNTTTPVAWKTVITSNGTYKIPLYQ